MEKFKNIFRSLDRSWLIRHYIFGFVWFAVLFYLSFNIRGFFPFAFSFFLLNFLLYPFAMFVYESLVDLIMGDNIFLIPILLMLIWKIVRFFFVWFLAIPIGVIGLAYLFFTVNRKSE